MEKTEKNIIRKQIKQNLKTLTDEQKRQKSFFACDYFLQTDLYKKSDYILSYMAMPTEISANDILTNALQARKIVALPKCKDNANDLSFYKISYTNNESQFKSQFSLGAWGIQEPNTTKCPLLKEQELSNKTITIIVPGVAFSANGTRLGHGKGYYDTYLSSFILQAKQSDFAINIVGMCFDLQIVPFVPAEKHDIPMHYLLTESGISKCFSILS